MALVTIKEFLESERTDVSVKVFVLRKLTNFTYEICDATAKCKMKVEDHGKLDFQVGEFKRILRPKKDPNDTGLMVNYKSRIVPTKDFILGDFSSKETDDESHTTNSNQVCRGCLNKKFT